MTLLSSLRRKKKKVQAAEGGKLLFRLGLGTRSSSFCPHTALPSPALSSRLPSKGLGLPVLTHRRGLLGVASLG